MRVPAGISAAVVLIAGCASVPAAPSAGTVGSSPAHWSVATASITSVPVRQRRWRFAGHDGQVLDTPHYRVYTTLTRHSLIDRLPLFLERALVHYTTSIAPLPEPDHALETFLFETRNQWEAKTRQMLSDQATTYLTLGRGGFTTRGTSVLYYIGRSDTLAIAAHEGWHQYSQRTFRNHLPLWLEEGLATYMEGYVSHPDGLPKFRPWANLERYHTLRDAVHGERLIPLEELLGRAPQSFLETGKSRLLIYYAQVWALTHFLAEGEEGRYRDAFQQALIDALEGRLSSRIAASVRDRGTRRGPAVVATYFDPDLNGFEHRYRRFVRSLVRTGGRSAIVQGRSPLAGD